MDLHYLKLFNALASVESYTKAAEILFISQPALSIQMKRFEEELGIKLFNKIGNRIELNDNGKLLYEYSKKIFTIIEEAQIRILDKRESVTGNLSIGGSNTAGIYILPKIIGEFKKVYPEVNINLSIGSTDDVASQIQNNQLDFAVNGGYEVYTNNVSVEKLKEDKVVLVVSPESSLAKSEFINSSDLEHMDFVTHLSNSQLYQLLENIITELNITAHIKMTFGSIDAIKQAVAANLGASAIPFSSVALELELGLIKEITIPGKEWVYPYSLIYNKKRFLSPAALKLMDMIREKTKGSK